VDNFAALVGRVVVVILVEVRLFNVLDGGVVGKGSATLVVELEIVEFKVVKFGKGGVTLIEVLKIVELDDVEVLEIVVELDDVTLVMVVLNKEVIGISVELVEVDGKMEGGGTELVFLSETKYFVNA